MKYSSKINVSTPSTTIVHEQSVFQYDQHVQVCPSIKMIISIRIRR